METFAEVAVKGRTLLLVEDLHLVDPESLICLGLLKSAPCEKPLFVLTTGRPESAYDAQSLADTILRLEPMPRETMRDLAARLWSAGVPSEQYLEQSAGSGRRYPVCARATCLFCRRGRPRLRHVDPPKRSVDDPRAHQPAAAETKFCAQGLSILGEEVELEFARKVLRMEKEELSAALGDLEKLAITYPVTGPSLRFRHAIIADACAITVPRTRRTDVHRAAIETIRATYSDLGGLYERLAFHAEAAGDDEAALEFLWHACNRASRVLPESLCR